jgi:hypothetical protein
MSRADDAHRLAQQRLATLVAERLGLVIAGLPDPASQQGMDTYHRAALPLVAGGQRHAAQLAFAYLARLVARDPSRQPPSLVRALEPVAVTTDSAVTRSPMLRLWYQLGQGAELAEAQQVAASYAHELSSNDLHAATRSGLDEAARSTDQRIGGWRKVLSGDACEWCQKVGAERVYHSADSVPFHARDHCSVAPVLESETVRHPLRGFPMIAQTA